MAAAVPALALASFAAASQASGPQPIGRAKAKNMTKQVKAAKRFEQQALTSISNHLPKTAQADLGQSLKHLKAASKTGQNVDTAGAETEVGSAERLDQRVINDLKAGEPTQAEDKLVEAIKAKNQAIKDLSSFAEQSSFTLNAQFAGSAANEAGAVNFCAAVSTSPPQHRSVTLTLTDPYGHQTVYKGTLDSQGKWKKTITAPEGGSWDYKLVVPGQQYPAEGNVMLGEAFGTIPCPTP